MALIFLTALAVTASVAYANPCTYTAAQYVWNGASSFNDMGGNIQASMGGKTKFPFYGPAGKTSHSGDGTGVGWSCLNGCQCMVGFGDDPMAPSDNAIWGTSKLTLPAVVATYSFFTGGNIKGTRVKLTALASYQIYKQVAPKWNSNFLLGGQSGFTAKETAANGAFKGAVAIIRMARQGTSGTTQVFKKFWVLTKAATGISVDEEQLKGSEIDTSNPATTTFKLGSTALCNAVASKKGAICYSGFGVCGSTNGVTEAWIKNKAGVWLFAGNSDPYAAIPATNFPADGAWNTIQTIWNAGVTTPAVASFIYAFSRKKSNKNAAFVALSKKMLGLLWTTNFAKAIKNAGYFPVVGSYATKNKAAVNLIGV